ncbi:Rap1a/Tai family immunity protein [Aurantimonas sp. NFXS3]|uniref:Rap1a/Tai family immunity protein n=1 Tax=Aurantimonas sp. NFXS3 TaxID=2818434 RepID=UPI003B8CCC60
MKNAIVVVMGIAVAIAAFGDKAESSTANSFLNGVQLYEKCNGGSISATVSCNSYIIGAIDSIFVLDYGKTVCAQSEADFQQLVDVVIRDLREIPEYRHYAAADIILNAMRKAFPCKQ